MGGKFQLPRKTEFIEKERNSAIEKSNINLYHKMKAILTNSSTSCRVAANPVYANFAPRSIRYGSHLAIAPSERRTSIDYIPNRNSPS
jgi:hypothetical protein